MRFFTPSECREWCKGCLMPLTPEGRPVPPSSEPRYARGPIATELAFCRYLERSLQPRDACLFWVTDWGVWRSSENLHLYYRLRQSYGDRRMLHEAPGHLFLDYEAPDLISFLQVSLLSGWDVHLLPSVAYARAFVSHDEYVDFTANPENHDMITNFAAGLGGAVVHGASAA